MADQDKPADDWRVVERNGKPIEAPAPTLDAHQAKIGPAEALGGNPVRNPATGAPLELFGKRITLPALEDMTGHNARDLATEFSYDDLVKDPKGAIEKMGKLLGTEAHDWRNYAMLAAMLGGEYLGPRVAAASDAIGAKAAALKANVGATVSGLQLPDMPAVLRGSSNAVGMLSPRGAYAMRTAADIADALKSAPTAAPVAGAPPVASQPPAAPVDLSSAVADAQAARASRFGTPLVAQERPGVAPAPADPIELSGQAQLTTERVRTLFGMSPKDAVDKGLVIRERDGVYRARPTTNPAPTPAAPQTKAPNAVGALNQTESFAKLPTPLERDLQTLNDKVKRGVAPEKAIIEITGGKDYDKAHTLLKAYLEQQQAKRR